MGRQAAFFCAEDRLAARRFVQPRGGADDKPRRGAAGMVPFGSDQCQHLRRRAAGEPDWNGGAGSCSGRSWIASKLGASLYAGRPQWQACVNFTVCQLGQAGLASCIDRLFDTLIELIH